MQGSSIWIGPTGTLGQIVLEAGQRVAELRLRGAELERLAADAPAAPPLAPRLQGKCVAVIAEVKRKSPSKGWIKADISAADQAAAYGRGGAAAISVLTEPLHFRGSVDDLIAVRSAVAIPMLKKDFHIDPIQLLEARAYGASAALLIVRALSPEQLAVMAEAARSMGLEVVVEVRDELELARALDVGASIIGVNNRNLETLEIDPRTSERLLGSVPSHTVAIAESGITSIDDVQRASDWGADAVLVGSSISGAEHPEAAVHALVSVARGHRAN